MLFDSRQIIRINISDDWSASDIATFLHELDYLYNLGLRIVAAATSNEQQRQIEMWAEKSVLSDHTKNQYPRAELEVCQIHYSSPGFTDLGGMGTVIGHIKDFLLRLIDYRVQSRRRALEDDLIAVENTKKTLENETIMLKNVQLRIENARQFLELAKTNGFTEEEIKKMIPPVVQVQETLVRLVSDGRIQSVELRDEAPDSPN
ncbi:MAG: hypothetical protein JST84_03860 [Acidobacteria bacterium]|nr:hypothetical protein [Acidobacteriota bacterium]